jgi:hypothetical protein
MKSEIDVQPQSAKHIDEGLAQNNGSEIAGRSVFAVGTSAAGIVVQTLFLAEDGRMLEVPAVFPNLGYALDQIDHLKRLVIERFEQAAHPGSTAKCKRALIHIGLRTSRATTRGSTGLGGSVF